MRVENYYFTTFEVTPSGHYVCGTDVKSGMKTIFAVFHELGGHTPKVGDKITVYREETVNWTIKELYINDVLCYTFSQVEQDERDRLRDEWVESVQKEFRGKIRVNVQVKGH